MNDVDPNAMRIGIGLPHVGALAAPQAIREVAIAAERAGLASLWAMDRLLAPVRARTHGYPGSTDGALPSAQRTVIDPLVALTVAATVTERIGIGTDVLVAPWYPPVLLARSLAALDQVSGGRLAVGLGLGWSVDEFEAVGVSMLGRGTRLDEILHVLGAVWADDTIEVATSRERIAASAMGVKPVQRPRPPILLGALSAAGLQRVARSADGWLPFGLPLDEIRRGWQTIVRDATDAGRDPHQLRLVVRGDPAIGARRSERARRSFTGSCAQVIGDINRAREIGAHELILDFNAHAQSTAELVDCALALIEPRAAAA
jgi:probable F420-dependent oxidoreductase